MKIKIEIKREIDVEKLIERLGYDRASLRPDNLIRQDLESAIGVIEFLCKENERLQEGEKMQTGRPDCFSMIAGCYEVCRNCQYKESCVYRQKAPRKTGEECKAKSKEEGTNE